MATFRKGDRVCLAGEVTIAELFTLEGTITRKRVKDGHYVYDVRLAARVEMPGSLISGLKVEGNLIRGVPASWLELAR